MSLHVHQTQQHCDIPTSRIWLLLLLLLPPLPNLYKCSAGCILGPANISQIPSSHCVQGANDQLGQVAERKLADKDVINQGDATQIARAEAKLNDGQIPPNSVSAKAQVSMLVGQFCFIA